ncbi:MAG: M23 family metallopeptidase [Clostridiales bacterium]|nr:M23 family metallopeptidase [Clostridiales bacterium]
MLSVSGIYGVYQYRNGQDQEPDKQVPRESAQVEETQEPEREAANSEGTVGRAETKDKGTEQAKIDTEEDIQKIGEAELAQAEEKTEEEVPEGETPEAEEAPVEEEKPVETAVEEPEAESFAFADDSSLLWPVDGDVILNYSMDKSIYFSTLNQYKYHPAIVISASVGSEVQCAARGKISKITVDEETGTTLYMELGDGYEAVYGQLKEVAVEEGDIVEAGELLGYVSEPTKYYTLEGSNLYFQLLKDGKPQNPLSYIE